MNMLVLQLLSHGSINCAFQKIIAFEGHTSNVSAVAFHTEGKWLVTGSEDGTIKIWDLRYVSPMSWCERLTAISCPPDLRAFTERTTMVLRVSSLEEDPLTVHSHFHLKL
jgi:WD40 repeat protein